MARRDPNEYLNTDDVQSDLGGKTVRGGALTAAGQVLKGLIEVGSTLVLARLLTPEDFGLLGMVIAVTGFIAMFKDLGLSMATVQREEITHDQVTALFWVNVGLSVLLTIITAAVAPVVAWFYEEPALLWVTIALAGAFLFSGLTVQHEAILKRNMRFGALVGVQLAGMVISVGLAIAAAMIGWEYWALVVKQIATAVVGAGGVWILCGWRPSRPRRGADVKELLGFGGNLTGFNVINYFARNLDDVLIGRLFGARSLGLYQKAYELLMVPLRQINTPIASVAIPALSRLHGEDERYRRAYLRILEKILMVTMPLASFLIASSDWVIITVLGEQWGEASPLFTWLGISIFTQPIGNSTGWLFISQDRTDEMLRWGVIGSITAIVSFLIGLPWGTLGVAVAYSLVGVSIRTPLLVWYVTRRGPIRMGDFYRTAFPPAVSAAAVYGAIWAFRNSEYVFDSRFLNLGVAVPMTVVATVAALAILPGGREALADLGDVVKMLRRQKDEDDDGSAGEDETRDAES